jgi:hypothetical protein
LQTFLPYESFMESVQCLDRQRLGKQRVEAMQIMNALKAESKSRWRNHPAVRMWRGYEDALGYYMNVSIQEWIERGYKNTMKLHEFSGRKSIEYPPWLGDYRLHHSHKCNLYRKAPDYYYKFFGNKLDRKAPYWWPVKLKNKKMNEQMEKYWNNV